MIIEHSLNVDYSCEQMFNLVSDYESYPEFIEHCSNAKTFTQNNNQVLAELEMSFAGIKQSFSTNTTFYPYEKITMELAEGPFQKLKGYWKFETDALNPQQTKVSLYMDYEMNSFMEFLLGNKFKKAMIGMVDCFIARAQQKYGLN
ncbi:type II toxin-antitoxin system RatA family toxin [Psittacicella hinzii]|uniref:Coenzyme Q-binding protein COQ10 START domain-containing protein n=1 Tax=Psittacicella hinzii TaxID=2028575 RepID=A0A3A1YJX3_9GAMM|nr:type II toxin-antitoxin system RatA family toxin [Psittacicella hinzii]RIY37965.1 hypothetical protein CKF58_04345 [Psittacicella hinzii]